MPASRRHLPSALASIAVAGALAAAIVPGLAGSSTQGPRDTYKSEVAADHPVALAGSGASRRLRVTSRGTRRAIVRAIPHAAAGSVELWVRPTASAPRTAFVVRWDHTRLPLRTRLAGRRWHHVVLTWRPSGLRLTVDGRLAEDYSYRARRGRTAPRTLEVDGVSASQLEDVRLYGTALSGARVLRHYEAGLPVYAPSVARAAAGHPPVAHAASVDLTATVDPAITGAATHGTTLTATPGTWTGTATITTAYQWERCDATGGACADLSGATQATYTLTPGDVGSTLRVRVTATNATGSADDQSAPTVVVAAAPPVVTTAPTVQGDTTQGSVLSAATGTWAGTPPITFSYDWLRCSGDGTGCESFTNPEGDHYTLRAADVGFSFRVRITATNAAGNAAATSVAGAPVVAAVAPSATADRPAFTSTDVTDGDSADATIGTFTGTQPMTYAHRWETCRDGQTPRCQQITGTDWSTDGTTAHTGALGYQWIAGTVRLIVTATNVAGSTSMTSDELSIQPIPLRLAARLDLHGQYASGAERFVEGADVYGGAASPTNGNATRPYTSTGAFLRCDTTDVSSCSAIPGTTSTSMDELDYTIASADLGHYLRVKKTVTNPAGSVTAYSDPQLMDHSAPLYAHQTAAFEGNGYDAVVDSLSVRKDPDNSGSGVQALDTLRWRAGHWIGDDMVDADIEVGFADSFAGDHVYSDRTTWMVPHEVVPLSAIWPYERATNAYGTTTQHIHVAVSISRADPIMPENIGLPKLFGPPVPVEGDRFRTDPSPSTGYTYTYDPGTWAGGRAAPDHVYASVLVCDTHGENCAPSVQTYATDPDVPFDYLGHNAPPDITYADLVGKTYKYKIVATNGAGSVSAETRATRPMSISHYRMAAYPDMPRWRSPDFDPFWGANTPGYETHGHDRYSTTWSIEALVRNITLPGLGADAAHHDPMILYQGRDDVNTSGTDPQSLTLFPGRGFGFGVRDDGCLYGAFGSRREFDLGRCLSTLELATAHDLAMTYDGTNVRFYVDGAQTATVAMATPERSQPFPENVDDDPNNNIGEWPSDFYTGERPRRNYFPNPDDAHPSGWGPDHAITNVLDGTVTDADAYIDVLTPAQVAAHAAGVAQDALIVTPVNTTPPAISGGAHEGAQLRAVDGTWTGSTPMDRDYQWQRCDATGAACADIDGATMSTYRLDADDVGHTVRVTVQAINDTGSDSAQSAATAVVTTGPPVVVTDPSIAGEAMDGVTLTVDAGIWAGTQPLTLERQWERCDEDGTACDDVAGATTESYTLTPDDIGHKLRVDVVATNDRGSTPGRSAVTDEVVAAPPTDQDAPTISGTAKVGETLTADDGTWTGTPPIDVTHQWLRCSAAGGDCNAIDGADGAMYVPVEADEGHTLRVRVLLHNVAGDDQASSDPTALVIMAPVATADPVISGVTMDGRTITAGGQAWKGTRPIRQTFSWARCDAAGADCADLTGATAPGYSLGHDDVGHRLRLTVTATNVAGATTRTVTTAPIDAAPPAVTRAPTLGGIAQPGGTLVAHAGRWTGTPDITYTYAWRECDAQGTSCSTIAGATGDHLDVTSGMWGETLRVAVTATNVVTGVAAVSAPSKLVGSFEASIDGADRIGEDLHAVAGEVAGAAAPESAYVWERCSVTGDDCEDIAGATDHVHHLSQDDVGHTLRVRISAVTSTNTYTATSPATAPIADAIPSLTRQPGITGRAAVGSTLSVTAGTWTPATATVAYQWLRCDVTGSGCAAIAGATDATYTVAAGDAGHALAAEVTGTTTGGSTSAFAAATVAVATPTLVNAATPVVTRHAGADGDTLSATSGGWTGAAPITYTYSWLHCRPDGSGCAAIDGATDDTYTLNRTDAGGALRVLVTAANTGGTETARSAATAVITEAAPHAEGAPSVVGDATIGAPVAVDGTTWSGVGPIKEVVQWRLCDASGDACADVDGATDTTYVPGTDDLGSTLRAVVTATGAFGSATATTAPSDVVTVAGSEDVGPVMATVPSIDGTPRVGETLAAEHGGWTSASAITYRYQWQDCDPSGAGCDDVADADDATYVATADDAGSLLRLIVTAIANGGESVGVAQTAQTIAEADGPMLATTPAITGTAREDEQLAVSAGTWTGGAGISTDVRWQRCLDLSGDGADDCGDIDDATHATYDVTLDDVDWTLRAIVTARDLAGHKTVAVVGPTAVVVPATPVARVAPEITGTATTGETLTADAGTWDGTAPMTAAYQWQSCAPGGDDCADVTGATTDTYTLGEGDAGTTLRVVVTETNAHGSDHETSPATAIVDRAGGPVLVDDPTVSGSPRVGRVLEVDPGTWTGTGDLSYTYQWFRCDESTEDCASVRGATSDVYTTTAADLYSVIDVAVTAHDDAGATTTWTVPTDTIGDSTDSPLANTTAPSITGDATQGALLTANSGSWSGADDLTFTYQWRICDIDAHGCSNIDGATDATYRPGPDDLGHRLRVAVIATAGTDVSAAQSTATPVIAPGGPVNVAAPQLSGDAMDGAELDVSNGDWQGTDVSYTYTWQRCDADGTGCAGLEGVTDPSYWPGTDDIGHTIRAIVHATGTFGTADAATEVSSVIAARPPLNDWQPGVNGVAMEGGTVSAYDGGWEGSEEMSYTYGWLRCDADGEDCAPIDGATADTYVLGADDVGATVEVVVTATNAVGQASATSWPSEVVAAAAPPTLQGDVPAITGDPHDGQTLTADPGSWYGIDPMSYTYQWQRCDEGGDNCTDISGATDSTYVPGADDLSSTLRVAFTVTNPDGSAEATSDVSDVISASAPVAINTPWVDTWDYSIGATLHAEPGVWGGSAPATYAYQWQRCDMYSGGCDDIDGATSDTYVISADDQRHDVRVTVTATNGHGSESSSSYRRNVTPLRSVNTALPTISTPAHSDQPVTATTGTWDNPPDRYDFQWELCDAHGDNCTWVWSARSSTYTPDYYLIGRTLRVIVTARNVTDALPPTATSEAVTVVGDLPLNVRAPSFDLNPMSGHAVVADPGVWSGAPGITYTYNWQGCDSAYGSCYWLGATGPEYTPARWQEGSRLRLLVEATNGFGTVSATSAISAKIISGPPHNTSAPGLSGDAVAGQTLTADDGAWEGTPDTVSYAWDRCDATGEDCDPIASALDSSYATRAADVGHALRVQVTYANGAGQETATSAPTDVLRAAVRPVVVTAPELSGDAFVGGTLSVSDGEWSQPLIRADYDWLRCDSAGDPCDAISGAHDASYRVRRADAGSVVRAVVHAVNGWGAASVRTAPSDEIPDAPAVASLMAPAVFTGGWSQPVELGQSIYDAQPGLWAGAPDTVTEQWQRCDPTTADPDSGAMTCTDIAGATSLQRYTPVAEDVGYELRIKETASAADSDDVVAYSDPTEAVTANIATWQGGELRGFAAVGETLTAFPAANNDAGLPLDVRYTFTRDMGGGQTAVVQDGDDPMYTLTDDDLGALITVSMAATPLRMDGRVTAGPTFTSTSSVGNVAPRLGNDWPPSIDGDTTAGATLTAATGQWHGGGAGLLYRYRWQRCEADGTGCEDIDGASNDTYRTTAADVDHAIRVVVAAHADADGPQDGGGGGCCLSLAHETPTPPVEATSDALGPIVAGTAPLNEDPPTVAGDPAEHETLTADQGSWSGGDLSYIYAWQSCDADGGGCSDIDGATRDELTPGRDELDHPVRVVVTATNAEGSVSAASGVTEPVDAGVPPTADQLPTLSILGTNGPGSTLVTDGGRWIATDDDQLSYSWQRCDWLGAECSDVDGAGEQGYQLTPDDVGQRLRVTVTAVTDAGSASASSELSDQIGTDDANASDDLVFVPGNRESVDLVDDRAVNPPTPVATCEQLGLVDGCSLHRPLISPNHKMIVVEDRGPLTADGLGEMYIMNIDGSGIRDLGQGSDPAWSADGTHVLFTATEDGGDTSYAASLPADGSDTTPKHLLPATPDLSTGSPDQATDGTLVVTGRGSGAGSEQALYVATDTGATPRKLTLPASLQSVSSPQFTSDESAITFAAIEAADWSHGVRQKTSVWQVAADGSGLTRITPDDKDTYEPGGGGELVYTGGSYECGSISFAASFDSGCNYEYVYPGTVTMVDHSAQSSRIPLANAFDVSAASRRVNVVTAPSSAAQQAELAKLVRPELRFDSGEQWRPLEVQSFVHERGMQVCQQKEILMRHGEYAYADPDCKPTSNPQGLFAYSLRSPSGNTKYSAPFLRIPRTYQSPDLSRCPHPEGVRDCDSGTRSAMYYNVSVGQRLIYVDWWYLLRNNPPLLTVDHHSGDWEGMTVGYDPRKRRVAYVGFSQHAGFYRYLAAVTQVDGRRTKVYVAKDSHASYPLPCDHPRGWCWQDKANTPHTSDAVRFLLGIGEFTLSKPMRDLIAISGGRLPEHSNNGRAAWGQNRDAVCFQGGQSCIKPIPRANPDTITAGTQVPDSTRWSGWKGKWGEAIGGNGNGNGEGGPQSPGAQRRFRTPFRATYRRQYTPENSLTGTSFANDAAATDDAAPDDQGADDGGSCDDYLGPKVVALACDQDELTHAGALGQMTDDGDAHFEGEAEGFAAGAAPGIAQAAADHPLLPGESIKLVGSLPATATLQVQVETQTGPTTVTQSDLGLQDGGTVTVVASVDQPGQVEIVHDPAGAQAAARPAATAASTPHSTIAPAAQVVSARRVGDRLRVTVQVPAAASATTRVGLINAEGRLRAVVAVHGTGRRVFWVADRTGRTRAVRLAGPGQGRSTIVRVGPRRG